MASRPALIKEVEELAKWLGDMPRWVWGIVTVLILAGAVGKQLGWVGQLFGWSKELIANRGGGPDHRKYLDLRRMFAKHWPPRSSGSIRKRIGATNASPNSRRR
jgi:hypothetical protein